MAQQISGRMPLRRAQASNHLEWLARAGLAARGVIYAVIGVLAFKLALGSGGETTDQQGAVKTIAEQPFGKFLLVVVAIGLFGYSLWRLVRAAVGHGIESGDDDAKERLSGLVSGLAYGLLCFTAIKILAGAGGGGGGGEDKATGGVLAWPAGQWLVGIAGVVLVAVGIDQGIKGVKKKFCDDTRTEQMSRKVEHAFSVAGVFGHLARMVIFALMGYFLVKAAIDYDAEKAVALDGALAKVAHASYGPFLLGLVAVGLLGFAVYSAMDARYRRV